MFPVSFRIEHIKRLNPINWFYFEYSQVPFRYVISETCFSRKTMRKFSLLCLPLPVAKIFNFLSSISIYSRTFHKNWFPVTLFNKKFLSQNFISCAILKAKYVFVFIEVSTFYSAFPNPFWHKTGRDLFLENQ